MTEAIAWSKIGVCLGKIGEFGQVDDEKEKPALDRPCPIGLIYQCRLRIMAVHVPSLRNSFLLSDLLLKVFN